VAAAWVVAGAPAPAHQTAGPGLGAGAGLEVEAEPRRFPVVGEVVAALGHPGAPRPAPLALVRFGWGGEEIAVARLQVPRALLDVPLVLTAERDGWLLTTEQGVALAEGVVGREAEGRAPDGGAIRMLVTALVARPGTEFLVRKRSCARAIAAARARGR
jgi:tyrosine-protein kinase Etk/Wzc